MTKAARVEPIAATADVQIPLLQNISSKESYSRSLWKAGVEHLSSLMERLLAGWWLKRSNFSTLSWTPFVHCQCYRKLECRIGHW